MIPVDIYVILDRQLLDVYDDVKHIISMFLKSYEVAAPTQEQIKRLTGKH